MRQTVTWWCSCGNESRRQLLNQTAFVESHSCCTHSLTLAVCSSPHLYHQASFSLCLSLLLSPSSNCMSNQCSHVQPSKKTFLPHSAPAPFFWLVLGSLSYCTPPPLPSLWSIIPALPLCFHAHVHFPFSFSLSTDVNSCFLLFPVFTRLRFY